jgi:hypothetical protein
MGVMTISFFSAQRPVRPFRQFAQLVAWLTAAAPGLIYSLLFSLSAFGWLVLRR